MTVKEKLPLDTPRVEVRKPLTLAGLRKRYNSKIVTNIPSLWRELHPYWAKVTVRTGKGAFGLVLDMNNAEGFDYFAGFEVSSDKNLPAEILVIKVPAQEYAIFAHRGHVSEIRDTMSAIWREWLPSSEYQVAFGSGKTPDAMEHYGEDFNPQTGMGDIEIWIPIRNREQTCEEKTNGRTTYCSGN